MQEEVERQHEDAVTKPLDSFRSLTQRQIKQKAPAQAGAKYRANVEPGQEHTHEARRPPPKTAPGSTKA